MLSDLDSVSAKREVKVERVAGLAWGRSPQSCSSRGRGLSRTCQASQGTEEAWAESRRQQEGRDRNQAVVALRRFWGPAPLLWIRRGSALHSLRSDMIPLFFQWADSLWGEGQCTGRSRSWKLWRGSSETRWHKRRCAEKARLNSRRAWS